MRRVEDLRPLRGRALLREIYDASPIVTPDTVRANKRTGAARLDIHRGVVLAMGAPARTKGGALVMPDYELGSEVLFVFALQGTEESRTMRMLTPSAPAGEAVVWVAQQEIVAVIGGGGSSYPVAESRHLGRGQ